MGAVPFNDSRTSSSPRLTKARQPGERNPSNFTISELSAGQQTPPSPSSASFSFPRLTPDGSVEQLQAIPSATISLSSRSAVATPPAALSSLGARSNMVTTQHSTSSVASLSDQYDMLDDVSEISYDGNETASLASTSHAGDGDDDGLVDAELPNPAPPRPPSSPITEKIRSSRVRFSDSNQDETLLDSFLAEELETPRQSTIAGNRFTDANMADIISSNKQPQSTMPSESCTIHILLMALQSVPSSKIFELCSRLSAFLTGAVTPPERCSRTVEFPPGPDGAARPLVFRFRTPGTELKVSLCVGADADPATGTHRLLINDASGGFVPLYTTRDGRFSDSRIPDVAIFYINNPSTSSRYPIWSDFDVTKRAMAQINVPILTILASKAGDEGLTADQLCRFHNSDMVLSRETLKANNDPELRQQLRNLLEINSVPVDHSSEGQSIENERPKVKPFTRVNSMSIALFILIAASLSIYISSAFPLYLGPADTGVVARRQALSDALFEMNLTASTPSMDTIQRLIPSTPNSLPEDYPTTVPYEVLDPNHILLSFPKQPGSRKYPTIRSITVHSIGEPIIVSNLSALFEGVYAITLGPQDPRGTASINVLAEKPYMNFTITHDFGKRAFQLNLPHTAELARTASKELALFRDTTLTWTHKVAAPLSASLKATKSVTTDLAKYMSRDLQIFSSTAKTVLAKAARESNHTIASLKKDLTVIRKDLIVRSGALRNDLMMLRGDFVARSNDLRESISTVLKTMTKRLTPSKRDIRSRLDRSHEQAMRLTTPIRNILDSRRDEWLGKSGNKLSEKVKSRARHNLCKQNPWKKECRET